MAVPSAYLTSTKNTGQILESIQKAAVPQVFTYEFLKQLGYTSSSDRPMIPVLKAVGFLDSSGTPTDLYRTYKDPAMARRALAQGLRAGYSDLFAVDTEAQTKNPSQLAGIFGRLSDKGDSVTSKMGTTFHALAQLADFSQPGSATPSTPQELVDIPDKPVRKQSGERRVESESVGGGVLTLRHDIHVHLPLSSDVAVFDAIFKSLRENLL